MKHIRLGIAALALSTSVAIVGCEKAQTITGPGPVAGNNVTVSGPGQTPAGESEAPPPHDATQTLLSRTTATHSAIAQGPIPGVPASLRIVQVAESYVGRGKHAQQCNCKRFVQAVVSEATAGAIAIPTTAAAPNQYRWNMPARYVQQIATSEIPPGLNGPFPDLRWAKQGDIVQMKPRNGGVEHTAIIAASDASGMRFVEANWTTCAVTNQRYVSFATLEKTMRWTLYRLTL